MMLKLIPRHPRKITAGEITARLEAEGHAVTKRTIERDLQSLSDVFPLLSDERERPFGWSWQQDASDFEIPGMSPVEALIFMLARKYLEPCFPAPMLDTLTPYFRQAEGTLGRAAHLQALAHWTNKVEVVLPTQTLIPPRCDAQVMETVHEALLQERQLKLLYKSRAAGSVNEYVVHPLGLVLRGAVTYLVGTLFDYPDPRSLALHRIERAEAMDAPRSVPEGFTLRGFIEKGAFGFEEKGAVRLVARFDAAAAEHLRETPLSEDQSLVPEQEDNVMLTATVLDTMQLRWWLLGFGDQVTVIEPASVRDYLARSARNMVESYEGRPSAGD